MGNSKSASLLERRFCCVRADQALRYLKLGQEHLNRPRIEHQFVHGERDFGIERVRNLCIAERRFLIGIKNLLSQVECFRTLSMWEWLILKSYF